MEADLESAATGTGGGGGTDTLAADDPKNIRYQELLLIERDIDRAADRFWNSVATDDAFNAVRQDWVACVGGSYSSESALLNQADQLRERGDVQGSDSLFAQSEACKRDLAPAFNAAAFPIADQWAVDNAALLQRYRDFVMSYAN